MNLILYPCKMFTRKNCKSPKITQLELKIGLEKVLWNFHSEIMAVLDLHIKLSQIYP